MQALKTLLPTPLQSTVLNARYKKPLQPFVLRCIFMTGKTIILEVFLFYLCIQFLFLFGNQNGNGFYML